MINAWKSYCFRNWRYDLRRLQETLSSYTFVPQEGCKQSRRHLSHCTPGWDTHCPGHCRTQIKTTTQNTDERMLQLFIWLTFSLNSNPLSYTFLLLKRVSLKQNLRRSVWVQTCPSQIADHLNKTPMKIQSLSWLVGSGGWQVAWTLAFLVSSSAQNMYCLKKRIAPKLRHNKVIWG